MKRRARFVLLGLTVASGGVCWLALAWLEQRHQEKPYSLVEDGLYLGRAVDEPPPGTTAVVNLCGRPDAFVAEHCLWEPILEGGEEPTVDWLRRVVDFIEGQRRHGLTTFVHCQAGMNRSAAVVTAYLMLEHGWSRDEALAFVQSKRPQAQPNPGLMRLLTEWERTCAIRKTEATIVTAAVKIG